MCFLLPLDLDLDIFSLRSLVSLILVLAILLLFLLVLAVVEVIVPLLDANCDDGFEESVIACRDDFRKTRFGFVGTDDDMNVDVGHGDGLC